MGSSKTRLVGWGLSALLSAFLIVASAGGKFTEWEGKAEMFGHLGYSSEVMFGIGIVEVAVAILFLIPRTAFIGAILLTAYLGGATATHVRVGDPYLHADRHRRRRLDRPGPARSACVLTCRLKATCSARGRRNGHGGFLRRSSSLSDNDHAHRGQAADPWYSEDRSSAAHPDRSHLTMSDNFTLELAFAAPVEKLYEALATKEGPRLWWTKFCQTSDTVGGISRFRFPRAGFFAHMEIVELQDNALVVWKCVDSRHPVDSQFSDLRDWVGTTIRFECRDAGEGTSALRMEHIGLTPVLDCFESCRSGWSYYLGDSLRALLETGEGKPYADDSEDNL